MNLVFLGPPGSGKGTQAKLLSEKLNLTHISTGALIRDEVQKDTEKARLINEIMKRGDLIPFETVKNLIEEKIKNLSTDFILDGTPRDLVQAEALDHFLLSINKPVAVAILFDLTEKEGIKRMLKRSTIENRPDDNESTIKHRYQVYQEETIPVIEYYQKQGKLLTIDANNTIDKIQEDLTRKLEALATKS